MNTSTSTEEPAPSTTVLETDVSPACNRLIAVLRDAARGWRIASDAVDGKGLAADMQEIAVRREEFATELDTIVASMSENDGVERHTQARLLTWSLAARAAMSHGDRSAILRACRLGNRAAIGGYDDALEMAMPDSLYDVIVRQANDAHRTADWLTSLS